MLLHAIHMRAASLRKPGQSCLHMPCFSFTLEQLRRCRETEFRSKEDLLDVNLRIGTGPRSLAPHMASTSVGKHASAC